MHAFDDAMKHFGISRPELLQLFRRVGVTELEARSGILPQAPQRWRRILQALGGQASLVTAPTLPQQSWHAYADSMERELEAPSSMHEAGQARAGSPHKRGRPDESVNHSPQQSAETPVSEQPDKPHAFSLGSWSVKRPRTSIGGGLPDPGTPTDADLAASFPAQDAVCFAAAEEDFPAFDDEEIEWLMELLP